MEHINIIGDTFNEDHDKVFDEVFEDVFAGNVTKVPKAWHAVLVSDLCTTTCHGVQNSLNDCHDDRQVRWCSGGVHAVHVVFAMSVQLPETKLVLFAPTELGIIHSVHIPVSNRMTEQMRIIQTGTDQLYSLCSATYIHTTGSSKTLPSTGKCHIDLSVTVQCSVE